MSNVEHGAGFHPKYNLNFSPMHIVPIGGGPVEIAQEVKGQLFRTVTLVPSEHPDARGTIHYKQGKEKVTLPNGEAIVPEGARISVAAYGVYDAIQFYVPKDSQEKPAVYDPNTTNSLFILEGTSMATGKKFPKVKPQFVAWYEKEKPEKIMVNGSDATKILGSIEMQRLVDEGFISVDQRHKYTELQVTSSDIIRAYMIHTIMKAHEIPLSAMRSRMITPYTEERLLYAMAQKEWKEIVARGREYHLDLQAEMEGLLRAARSHTNATHHTRTQSYQ